MTVSASDHRLPDWSVGCNVEPVVMSIRNTQPGYAYFARRRRGCTTQPSTSTGDGCAGGRL